MSVKHFILKSFLLVTLIVFASNISAQDPNFYIFLSFGQSNMEGQGAIENQDKTVDSRFQTMAAVNCTNLGRTKGNWYTAVPPLTRCYSGLSPADYFGRTMVANLPDSIRVGIINVSVAGCKIELFDKDNYQTYVSTITESWLKNIINEYGGNPYGHLIEVAKMAQADGVIKGILLHQGESNTGDQQWPAKVKKIYENFLADLSLNADSVPLLAGEVVHADQGGICASMNSIIAKLPQTVATAHVISSSKCTDAADNLHFNSAGYRELGSRYAATMLSLLGYEVEEPEEPEEPEVGTESIFFEAECATVGENWDIIEDNNASEGKYVTVKQGTQSLSEPATSSADIITIPFTVSSNSAYSIYALLNCPTADDDSFWLKMDNGEFSMHNGLATSGWQWVQLNTYDLAVGNHTLTLTYREDGAKLDKVNISNYTVAPTGKGETALNICNADTTTVGLKQLEMMNGYLLGHNYPNPFNDFTVIEFEIPDDAHVSLKIYNLLGHEIAELAGKKYSKGKHSIEFDASNLSHGQYFYTLKTNQFVYTRRMVSANNKNIFRK